MRWMAGKSPENGNKRVRTVFCLFPKWVLGRWVWLEKIRIEEEFNRDYVNHEDWDFECWTITKEIESSK